MDFPGAGNKRQDNMAKPKKVETGLVDVPLEQAFTFSVTSGRQVTAVSSEKDGERERRRQKEWEHMNGNFSDIDEEDGEGGGGGGGKAKERRLVRKKGKEEGAGHVETEEEEDDDYQQPVSICARIFPSQLSSFSCVPERHQKLFRLWVCPALVVAVLLLLGLGALYRFKRSNKGASGSHSPGPPPVDICTRSSVPFPDITKMTVAEKVGQMLLVPDYALGSDGWDASGWFIGAVLSGPALKADLTQQQPTAWLAHVRKFQQAVSATRLQIPLLYGLDGVHGHNGAYGATIYPHNIGLGAARDPALVQKIAAATADEMAATGIHWNFAPCIAVCRDPRWGRCYESFSEDPELVNLMNAAIDGYQVDPVAGTNAPIYVAATAKHYVADGGTQNGQNAGLTVLPFDELNRVHIFPYRAAVKKNVQFVMASYSAVNGTRMSANKYLLTDILKGELGFKGAVVSDWNALSSTWGMGGDDSTVIASCINAGMDMIMAPPSYVDFITKIKALVKEGTIPMSRIDDAVTRVLQVKRNMGLFNRTCSPALSDSAVKAIVGSKEHKELARTAVRQSLTLLHVNETSAMFPLKVKGAKILVAGTHADDIGLQCGGWTLTWQGASGPTVPGISILQGIKNATQTFGDATTSVEYVLQPSGEEVADFGIVVVGEQPYAETKGDNQRLVLNPEAMSAIQNVCSNMKCIVILISGRPLLVQSILSLADVFIAAWLPGAEAGAGIADVLFDSLYDFGGMTPMTWPKTVSQLPLNFDTKSVYDPLFAYGFGLSKSGKVLELNNTIGS